LNVSGTDATSLVASKSGNDWVVIPNNTTIDDITYNFTLDASMIDGTVYSANTTGWQVLENISAVVVDGAPETRFNGTHLVRWDDSKAGGKWYECNITEAANN